MDGAVEALEDSEDVQIVVVVGDGEDIVWGNESEKICAPIKEEPLDEREIMNIIAAAQKHGQPVKLEFETEQQTVEYFDPSEYSDLTFEQAIQNIKQETKNEEVYYVEEEVLEDDFQDPDYIPCANDGEYKQDSDSEIEYKPKGRYKMVPDHLRKSFIDDLRQQYPELKQDEKALIKTLAEIMRNIKPPKLPDEFCIPNDNMFE